MKPEPVNNPPTGNEPKEMLVIALDFGTTFSGVSYSFESDEDAEVDTIIEWPWSDNRQLPKFPTLISYDLEPRGGFTWGGQEHRRDVIRGIKLLLDPEQATPAYLPAVNARESLKDLNKSAVTVASDFMKVVHDHALKQIMSTIPAEYADMYQKRYVLTVPAVWSDKAKDMTLRAARQAGMYSVTLIKEPEAAAVYTLHTLRDRALDVGDAMVICDAGGGTVDLISYEITQVVPNLELKELVPGTGEMAGSMGLNRRFEEAVKRLVGEDQFRDLRRTRAFSHAMEEFDKTLKVVFRDQEKDDYFVNFPMATLKDDKTRNLLQNCWIMKRADMADIFEPLIRDIERLVADQVDRVKNKRLSERHPNAHELKAIFLVGGFGSSEYLRSRLQSLHPNIQVIQPHDAWSAVAKGAVLSQLPNKAIIVSAQATRYYGVEAWSKFNADEDQGQPTRVDVYGTTKARRMTWYIQPGDDLRRMQKIRFRFYRTLPNGFKDSDLIFEDQLLQHESSPAPIHPGPTVKTNCKLKSDLRTADRSVFRRRIGVDGKFYFDVYYDLAVTIMSAVMNFSLEVNGKEMGRVRARYDR